MGANVALARGRLKDGGTLLAMSSDDPDEPSSGPPCGHDSGPIPGPIPETFSDPRGAARAWAGWALSGLGLGAIVLSTIMLASAGYGTRVRRSFSERRTYDMVKPAVQRALPRVALTGLTGLGLMIVGTGLRRRARRSA